MEPRRSSGSPSATCAPGIAEGSASARTKSLDTLGRSLRVASRYPAAGAGVSRSQPLPFSVDVRVTKLASKLPKVGRSTVRGAKPRTPYLIGTQLSGNAVRLEAIYNVEAYIPPAVSFVPGEEPGEIF